MICVHWGERVAVSFMFCGGVDAKEIQYYYIDTDEIPGFFLLIKNHIFIALGEDTIFIFHV